MLCGILWAFTFFVPPSKVLQVRILEREKEVLVGLATRLKKNKKKSRSRKKKNQKAKLHNFYFIIIIIIIFFHFFLENNDRNSLSLPEPALKPSYK
jgi:dolichol kinase